MITDYMTARFSNIFSKFAPFSIRNMTQSVKYWWYTGNVKRDR